MTPRWPYRNIKFIFQSQADFVDLWITLLIFVTSLYIFIGSPIKEIVYYHVIYELVNSNVLGGFGLFISMSSIVRLFYPKKPPISLCIGLRSINFGLCFFMFISMLNNSVIPLSAVLYGMISLLSLDNIRRT